MFNLYYQRSGTWSELSKYTFFKIHTKKPSDHVTQDKNYNRFLTEEIL